MIVNYPTGLYASILPHEPQDVGNITYTISMQPPPRTNLLFPKISTGIVLRTRTPTYRSPDEIRRSLGKLVFSISSASRVELGNNARQYEIGDVLEFGAEQGAAVDAMLVSDVTELRHDTNLLDNAAMGLSLEDVALVTSKSLETQIALMETLADLKRQRADAEETVTTQQKMVNETSKTLSALRIILSQSTGTDDDVAALIAKLEVRQAEAVATRDAAIVSANQYADEADVVLAKLRTVAVVVK